MTTGPAGKDATGTEGASGATGEENSAVFFHAHPDDEALLTSGTIARLAAAGRRVVLVLATAGDSGLAASELRDDGRLAERRLAELQASAEVLGVHRVVVLGYRDSGMADDPTPVSVPGAAARFVDADPGVVAGRLAEVLREERAAVLTTYDAAGGYGHPDHRQVHRVGALAAQLAGSVRVLEATLPREPILRVLRWADRLLPLPAEFPIDEWQHAYTPIADITHRIDVRPWLAQRRASMRAHASQATADRGMRTLGVAGRLPPPVFGWVFGTEWYREPALAGLRLPPRTSVFGRR